MEEWNQLKINKSAHKFDTKALVECSVHMGFSPFSRNYFKNEGNSNVFWEFCDVGSSMLFRLYFI